jgi:hypothetical protein
MAAFSIETDQDLHEGVDVPGELVFHRAADLVEHGWI